jgi:hypothetical protein
VYAAAYITMGDDAFPDYTHHAIKNMVNKMNIRYLKEVWEALGGKMSRKDLYENAIHASSRWILGIYNESKCEIPLPECAFS